MQAAPHPFDHQVAREIQQIGLADARRAGRAHLVVEVEPSTQDRRIADTPGNLPRQARRSSSCSPGRRGCRAPSSESCRSLDWPPRRGRRRRPSRREAGSQSSFASRVSFQCSQIRRLSSVRRSTSGKPCARANRSAPSPTKQTVPGALHHDASHGGGVHDVADRGHRTATVGRPVHHGGIQLDDSVFVGKTSVTDGVVFGIGFHDRNAFDRRVERIIAALQELHRLRDRTQAVAAGDDDRSFPAGRLLAVPPRSPVCSNSPPLSCPGSPAGSVLRRMIVSSFVQRRSQSAPVKNRECLFANSCVPRKLRFMRGRTHSAAIENAKTRSILTCATHAVPSNSRHARCFVSKSFCSKYFTAIALDVTILNSAAQRRRIAHENAVQRLRGKVVQNQQFKNLDLIDRDYT